MNNKTAKKNISERETGKIIFTKIGNFVLEN